MDIVLTGSIAFDYLMRFPGRFTDHILPEKLSSISLSFLVDSMVRQRGGIAPNIAYSYALLGGRPRLFATVGDDFEDYRLWLEAQGIDTSLVRTISGINSASFFANTDQDNNQIASFYPGAMSYAGELSFHDLDGDVPDLVFISPTDPAAMRSYVHECQELFIPYIFDPSQQLVRLPPEDIRQGVEGARALFVNEYEFSLIEKHTGMDLAEILNHVDFLVKTLAKNGARIYAGDERWEVEAFPTDVIRDPTGVGDAFRGGFLTGLRMGWDYELCGMVGSLSATYCLEALGPQGQSYTIDEYIARFREYFDDDRRLDRLLTEQEN
jgi:adenosine kinase